MSVNVPTTTDVVLNFGGHFAAAQGTFPQYFATASVTLFSN